MLTWGRHVTKDNTKAGAILELMAFLDSDCLFPLSLYLWPHTLPKYGASDTAWESWGRSCVVVPILQSFLEPSELGAVWRCEFHECGCQSKLKTTNAKKKKQKKKTFEQEDVAMSILKISLFLKVYVSHWTDRDFIICILHPPYLKVWLFNWHLLET